jgi:hypothetical protein
VSKTPFTDFLWKLHKDRAFQNHFSERILAVFKAEGLTVKHARALLTDDYNLVIRILDDEAALGPHPLSTSLFFSYRMEEQKPQE